MPNKSKNEGMVEFNFGDLKDSLDNSSEKMGDFEDNEEDKMMKRFIPPTLN